MTHEILEKLGKLGSRHSLEESHVQHLFALARKLIERSSSNDRTNYALLKFYCDWTLHSQIDRSEEGALVLARIHNIIHTHLRKSNNSDMANDITAALSLEKVREQLNRLILKTGGSRDTFSKARWNDIIPILAEIISRSILKIGRTSRLSKILQMIKSKPLKGTSVVEELSIIRVPSDFFGASDKNAEITFCFCINTTDTTKFIIPLMKAGAV